jgi:hypothetical protein
MLVVWKLLTSATIFWYRQASLESLLVELYDLCGTSEWKIRKKARRMSWSAVKVRGYSHWMPLLGDNIEMKVG